MKALLGRKLGMSQVFSNTGEVVPVTLIVAEPNTVTIRRTLDRDGYTAVQLALPKKTKKGEEKSTKEAKPKFAGAREFQGEIAEDIQLVGVDQFAPGDVVQVAGISKGKGYQGVVKRHHFKGGPASHGHKHVLRQAGSIGARFPQHTRKGVRMAGRMGGERVTVKNLSVVVVDPAKNLLALKGAVPGTRGSIVEICAVPESSEEGK